LSTSFPNFRILSFLGKESRYSMCYSSWDWWKATRRLVCHYGCDSKVIGWYQESTCAPRRRYICNNLLGRS
jgi:hypothetical protein